LIFGKTLRAATLHRLYLAKLITRSTVFLPK
jgi:hypothetical protein